MFEINMPVHRLAVHSRPAVCISITHQNGTNLIRFKQ